MDTLKIIFISIFLVLTSASALQAQHEKRLQEAFAASYKHETDGDYTKAADILRKEYDEFSYEINLRLGWLTYLNGSFTESSAFYSKAIQLMPLSIEARLGFVLPATSRVGFVINYLF